MKFEYWCYNSSIGDNVSIGHYPILDWGGYYNPKDFEWGSMGPGLRYGFTGKYCKRLVIRLVLFRREFGLMIMWAHGQMEPTAAKKAYHAKFKNKE